jgi:ParB family chromosome partitioning protein
VSEVVSLPVERIRPGDNDRTVFNAKELSGLADSIREIGLQNPIIVRPLGDVYEVMAGERRFRACRLAGLTVIPSLIRPATDEEASAIMLAENTGRSDLDPVDEAFGYSKRIARFGWTEEHVAEKAGVKVERVRSRLRLTKVRPDILKLVRSGNFPIGHAEALADLDHNRQMLAARPLIEGKRLNRREFQQVVDHLIAQQNQAAMFDLTALGGPMPEAVDAAPSVVAPDFPTNPHLPPLKVVAGGTGPSILAYLDTLQAHGFIREAHAVGNVLKGLVEGHCARLPVNIR